MHAYTYSAHPTACAIANAMIGVVEKDDFPKQAEEKGKRLLVGLKDALSHHPNVGEIRGLGLMCGIEYVKDRDTKEFFDPEDGIGAKLNNECISRGLFSRVRNDAYLLAPPIVTDNQTIDEIVDIVAASTKAVLG